MHCSPAEMQQICRLQLLQKKICVTVKIDIMGLLVASGLCASRSEARRAVQQGGVAVNGEKVGSIEASYKPEDINKEDFVLRRGKKNYRKIIFE